MKYYIRFFEGYPPQRYSQVWRIDESEAVRLGVSNPKNGPGTYFKANPGEKIWEAIQRDAPGWFGPNGENPFIELNLGPGQYYPRMARPIDQHPDDGPGWSISAQIEPNVIAVIRGQLSALTRSLGRICQTVHPDGNALDSYGHDIRNLLILACTEVETQWRGVLAANAIAAVGQRLTTKDYVKLNSAMRLNEYGVAFPNYPWLFPFKPYEAWGTTGNSTQELAWYDAYNAVKHDRENHFSRGTLRHAFEAVSACAIMLVAQFGQFAGLGKNSELRDSIQITAVPRWPYSDIYVFPYGELNGEWSSVNFKF